MNRLQRLEQIIPTRVRSHLTLFVIAALIVCTLSLLLFAKLVDGVSENDKIVQFDLALANALHSAATTTSTSAFITISLFGGQILLLESGLVTILLAWKKHWLALIMWLITIAGGYFLNSLLKQFFARPRPTFANPLVIEQFYSFPSGHSMLSIIAYGMMAYIICLLLKNNLQRFIIVLLGIIVIALIGLSRLALGVHYFSDVLAGYAVGALWLMSCIGVWRFIHSRREATSPTA